MAASSYESSHLRCEAVALGDSRRFEGSYRLRLQGLSLHGLIAIEDEDDTIIRNVGAPTHPATRRHICVRRETTSILL
jgi:hypothetical protein